MWPESGEQPKPLRTGLTTGTCATACCVAAAQALLAGKRPEKVEVTLPKGKERTLLIEGYDVLDDGKCIRTSTIKDAGDDPDVTHGARIFVELSLSETPGVTFLSAQGVGTVTREGLVLGIGEPAINPVPRAMMTAHLEKAAIVYKYRGGFKLAVGAENGELLAQKTMNPRLGIVGGLSILGTTGIVRPYSCAAYISSIHQGIDVANANGIQHIAATTGSTSEAAIQAHYQLDAMALLEMGDFVGAVLKHLRKVPIAKVSLCGGFGKISKLANGHMDLNSRSSSIDFAQLAAIAKTAGADAALLHAIGEANTSMQVFELCQSQGVEIGDLLCAEALRAARKVVRHKTGAEIVLEVWAVDRRGNFIGSAVEGSL